MATACDEPCRAACAVPCRAVLRVLCCAVPCCVCRAVPSVLSVCRAVPCRLCCLSDVRAGGRVGGRGPHGFEVHGALDHLRRRRHAHRLEGEGGRAGYRLCRLQAVQAAPGAPPRASHSRASPGPAPPSGRPVSTCSNGTKTIVHINAGLHVVLNPSMYKTIICTLQKLSLAE
jgi:hypothetical protein